MKTDMDVKALFRLQSLGKVHVRLGAQDIPM